MFLCNIYIWFSVPYTSPFMHICKHLNLKCTLLRIEWKVDYWLVSFLVKCIWIQSKGYIFVHADMMFRCLLLVVILWQFEEEKMWWWETYFFGATFRSCTLTVTGSISPFSFSSLLFLSHQTNRHPCMYWFYKSKAICLPLYLLYCYVIIYVLFLLQMVEPMLKAATYPL